MTSGRIAVCCFLSLLPTLGNAVQGQEEDFASGLLGRYSDGETEILRVDSQVAFSWDGDVPDQRLRRDVEFTGTWQGQILVRQSDSYRFHAFVQGDIDVLVDGRKFLSGSEPDSPGWISSEPFPLDFGDRDLKIRYRRTGRKARVALYWSSDSFPLEPLPENLLHHDSSDGDSGDLDMARDHLREMKCLRCHAVQDRIEPVLPPAGPDLSRLRDSVKLPWLLKKLLDPPGVSSTARMPHFHLQPSEADAVAAYLWHRSEAPELVQVNVRKREEDRSRGEELFYGIGCLACHSLGDQQPDPVLQGGDLSRLREKRSLEWIVTWLERPESLNRDHRMPVFPLSPDERRQLAVFLADGKVENGNSADAAVPQKVDALIQQGGRLIGEAGCANCHRIPDREPVTERRLLKGPADATGGCLDKPGNARIGRPYYPQARLKQIAAAVAFERNVRSTASAHEQGRQAFRRLNCSACHERGIERGLAAIAGRIAQSVPALNGQSQALIPPSLQAVGDKLREESIRKTVFSKHSPRLPWLRVRMPHFQHAESLADPLLDYLVSHDRIPDDAPDSWKLASISRDDSLVNGHLLIGPRGLSCIACHQVGDYQPGNVALGTRGSDLQGLGDRMRPEYFLRWTRSPLRIVPGMEMPSYMKPVPGILNGDMVTQLSAIWHALDDPDLTVPANPSVVEQYWFVRKGEPARIVRDVMTCPEPNGGGYTARPLMVGFENAHTLVLDLDRYQIRDWRFGDLGKQRTQGKSWYWDAAGVPLVTGLLQPHDWALVSADEETRLFPVEDQAMRGRLHNYLNHGSGIEFRFDLMFQHQDQRLPVRMKEAWHPVTPEPGRTGVERSIDAEVPKGWQLRWIPTEGSPRISGAMISLRESTGRRDVLRGDPSREKSPAQWVPGSGDDSNHWCLLYHSDSTPADLVPRTRPPRPVAGGKVDSVPGMLGRKLPISQSIMPTAMCWRPDGTLAFTSLKGQVYLVRDTDGDGLEDELSLFEEGLSAPFGIIADGNDLIVAHKPEVIRLRDNDRDGRADQRMIVATGWGHSDNYHDWTCGIVRDSGGRMYVGLGSDYAQSKRPRERSRWRGAVLGIDPDGTITPVGRSFRYPTGLAINGDDQIFVTDNQGVQNTFNEINHLQAGTYYGVPSRYETQKDAPVSPPAIQVPHPWTRSVNGITFLPDTFGPLAGQGIGCEYDTRFLIRFSTQKVGEIYQGATYEFSDPKAGVAANNFLGPLCTAVSPEGELYVGSIHDSGWLGGLNTGEIVRLSPKGKRVNGIRRIEATPDGFHIEFLRRVDAARAADPANYFISAYTRVWSGSYGTPDSERHRVGIREVRTIAGGESVELVLDDYRSGFVYEISTADVAEGLWPSTGHYTLHVIPDTND